MGRFLIALVAVATIVGGYIADWNKTHLYNPLWPPHAKFHDAQTILLGTFLGLASLWFLFAAGIPRLQASRLAALAAAFYWISQAGALLFAGTALVDPNLRGTVPLLFGFRVTQLNIDSLAIALLAIGYVLISRRDNSTIEGANARL